MPVLDWTLPRKKSSLPKLYKIDVISMTDQDSFSTIMPPEKAQHGTLRKIKSLNNLLDDEVGNYSNGISKSGSGEISKPEIPSTEARGLQPNLTGSAELWPDHIAQRGAKKPTEKFIVSGFSTLSRRAGGGMEVPDINMQAVRVFLRNGTHKTVRTNPDTTCKDVLQSVLKKTGLQESTFLYGLYIQYSISDGRIAQDDESIANINPNTWDSVTRIYLCRRPEYLSTQTRSRCVSFARDFLEMEQTVRSDSNIAYDIKEFTNIQQKHIQVSTHYGRRATVAVHKSSANKDMVVNKLIVDSFAECWVKANRQLNISNDHIESGVTFKTVKTSEINKRKMSVSIGTINRSYTIERGKERRPALAKMFSTGSLETSSSLIRSSASPLLQNVNANSNNSNNHVLIPQRSGSMVNLYQHTAPLDIHPFARPLEHSSSLPVIKISTITEENDEIYSIPSTTSLSLSGKSELLHKLSPSSSFSSLDLPRKDLHTDSSSYQSSRSPSPVTSPSPLTSPCYQNCSLVASRSLPTLATNEAINTSSDVLRANKQPGLEFGKNKTSELNMPLPTKEPLQPTLLAPPPLPPPRRKHSPTTYCSSTLPMKRSNLPKKFPESRSHDKQELMQHDDREVSDSIGEMPKYKGATKLRRRRSISLSDLRSSLEKRSSKLMSVCNVETLKKATVMKIPGAVKSRQVPQQKLIKQPEDYHNVSIKELMAIRAAVTSSFPSRSGAITITPKPHDNEVKRPVIPKRHSSLLTSDSSDEEIVLMYKRMSSDSLYSCQDIDVALGNDEYNTDLKHDGPSPICDPIFTSGDALYTQKSREPTLRLEANPVSLRHVHNTYNMSAYDHLHFSESANSISNTTVSKDGRHSEVTLQDYDNDEESQIFPSINSHYNKMIHFCHKTSMQETFSKPYSTLQPVATSWHKPRPRAVVLKKPSCSHIYEDIDSDYEDIEDDDDDYVVMECKKASPVPPPPLLPHSFSNSGFKTQQQITQSSNTQRKMTKPQPITVSSVVDNSTRQVPKSPVEPQIKIMVGRTSKTSDLLSVQDELKNKIQAESSDTHEEIELKHTGKASPTMDGHCTATSNKNISAVSKETDSGKEPTELEAKFLAMKRTHISRKEIIQRTESKLETKTNTTKRIELHNYTNTSKNFMVLKEEQL